ncbi:DUF4160 domain-containing protein [Endozoicomonas sp. ONNA2]|uniref:DUF4160 domain-containing protein n=1 Tax=Endozoicomonas sp. ONNA2 TaxID=2828741 RepID=UPI0035A1259D
MPVISTFFGIYIRMYHADHAPPHFHAEYQGHEALVDISTGHVLEGGLPKKEIWKSGVRSFIVEIPRLSL